MLKKILAGVTAALLALGVVALVAGPASAHHNTISATVACSTTGYTITWSVVNSERDKSEEIKESNSPSVVPVGTTLAAGETKTFTQTVTAPQDVTLNLKGFWAATNVYSSNSGSVSAAAFPAGCLETSPVVSKVQAQCDGPNHYSTPSYTIGGTGVVWYINGVQTASGTYPATVGTPIHAEAKPLDSRYKLTGQTVWDYTFQAPTDPCVGKVVPVEPTFSQQSCVGQGDHTLATYFIPTVTGVLYTVKIDGKDEVPATPGTNRIPDGVKTIQVIARGDAAKFYVIEGDAKVYDVFTVLDAGKCLTDVTPVKPASVQALCDVVKAPGTVPDSTYTLTYVPHVIYQVSIDGAPAVDTVLTQTTTYVVADGVRSVVVTARADDPTKYQTPAFTETLTFTDPGDCLGELALVKPSVTPQWCDDSGLTDGPLDSTTGAPDAATSPAAGMQLAAAKTISGQIIIPETPNVTYFLDGVEKPAGAYDVAVGKHIVSVGYDKTKYSLPEGLVVPFEVVVTGAPCLSTDPLVAPAAVSKGMTCLSDGSITLSNDLSDSAAILWTVNGASSTQGTFPVSSNGVVTVTAAPNAPAYGFAQGTQTSWTFTFARPAGCDLQTLALTGQSPLGMLVIADILVVAGLALVGMRALRRTRTRPTVG